MPRPQFSLRALLAFVAVPASAGAVIACLRADDARGFILANLWLAFFAWVAIRQTRNPTRTALGCLAAFMLLTPVLLLAALWLSDMD